MSPDIRPDGSNTIALNPVTVSAGAGKGLIEQENKSAEGAEAAFATLVESMVQSMTWPEALPEVTTGGELPGEDAALPDIAAVFPSSSSVGAELLPSSSLQAAVAAPVIGTVDAIPGAIPSAAPVAEVVAGHGLSKLLASGVRPPASKPLNLDQRALAANRAIDEVSNDEVRAADEAVLAPSFNAPFNGQGENDQNPDSMASLNGTGIAMATTLAAAPSGNPINPDTVVSNLNGLIPSAERVASQAESPRLSLDSKLPLMSPQFVDRFAEQVTVLVEHGVKLAHLSLNPPDLGPIEVRITLFQDDATVQFASHHGVVREAMVDALPKLREMLEGAGLRLNDSGVFAQLPQRENLGDRHAGMSNRETPPDPRVEQFDAPSSGENRALHLIDAYV